MKEILFEWNPWWSTTFTFSGIKREMLRNISPWLSRKEVLAILGVRRSGKTTLLWETIDFLLHSQNVPSENIFFIKADDERLSKKDLINKVLEEYYKWKQPKGRVFLFIDEIQEIPLWQKTLKRIYDLEGNDKKMFISGSNGSLLKEELSSLLTGRFAYFEVYPFTFREFLFARGREVTTEIQLLEQRRDLQKELVDYLSFGGFPEVVLEKNENRKIELLRFYYDSILLRDIIKRKNIRNTEKMTALIEIYLQNIAAGINFNKMGILLGLTTDSVREYTKYLEEAYLLFTSTLYAHSLKKQYVNPKKMYAVDIGMRRIVGFTLSQDFGKAYENMVFIELKRRGKKIFYWKNEHECDFVIKEGAIIKQAFQVCYEVTEENKERELKGLLEALENFNLTDGTVITGNYEAEQEISGKKIYWIPLWKWLLNY